MNVQAVIFMNYIIQIILAHMLYSNQLKKRNVNPIVYWTVFIAIYFISYRLFSRSNWLVNMAIFTLANVVITALFFTGSSELRLCMAVYYTVNIFLTELIGLLILDLFVDRVTLYEGAGTVVIIVISKGLTFLSIRLTCALLAEKLRETKYKPLYFFSLIMIVMMMLLNVIVYSVLNHPFDILHVIYLLSGSFGFIVFILFFLNLLAQRCEKEAISQALEEQKLKYELEHQQYQTMLDKYEYTKILTHDLNKYISILRSYIVNGENDKAICYIDKFGGTVNEGRVISSTGNLGIDVVLNNLRSRTERENIKLDTDIQDVIGNVISDTDISIILGNITDNAVESCIKCDKRYIRISIYQKGQSYVIKVVNSCCEFPRMVSGMPVTTKMDTENHGLGTKSIKHLIERYDGKIIFNPDTANCMFETAVTIPANNDASTQSQKSQTQKYPS